MNMNSNNKYHESVVEFYDKFACKYNESRTISGGRLFNEFIEMPAVLSLLNGKMKDKKVLDIGCGIGIYTRHAASLGAKVTGIDISSKMLAIAEQNCKSYLDNIRFYNTSFESFRPTLKQRYDIIIGGFMLSYFRDLTMVFQKCKNLLSDENSFCIFSMIHPIKLSSLRREDGKYVLGDYFDEDTLYASDFMGENKELFLKKWTFSDISYSAKKAKLLIDVILEPVPQCISRNIDRDLVDFYSKSPSVLVIKLKKQ